MFMEYNVRGRNEFLAYKKSKTPYYFVDSNDLKYIYIYI